MEFRNRAFYRMSIESSKLLILVENLLDISRGAVKREYLRENVSILDITKECIKSLDNRSIRNSFIIKSNEIIIINANKDDITTIIYNLIDNAIKYSKWEDIKITIGDRDTIFKIENEIYKIPEDKKDKLLEPFMKYNFNLEQNREEKISSSELGLYLCYNLAQTNNLKLSYEIINNIITLKLSELY